MNATLKQSFYLILKDNQLFSYTNFPVNKINVGKVSKLWEIVVLLFFLLTSWNRKISGCYTAAVVCRRCFLLGFAEFLWMDAAEFLHEDY
jgi:hypothetical protein